MLTNLILLLLALIACNQTNIAGSDSDVFAIFSADDIRNALPTTVNKTIELTSVDLANKEINIEGDLAPKESDSELTNQAVLSGATGYLTYVPLGRDQPRANLES